MARVAAWPLTSHFLIIAIDNIRNASWMRPGHVGTIEWSTGARIACAREPDSLHFRYRHKSPLGEPEEIEDRIPLTHSRTNFGGRRLWFVCPSCQRRCGRLYGGRLFRCRLCVGARYVSQRETVPMRIIDQQWKIRRRLEERTGQKWLGDLDDGLPDAWKPKNMRWRTWRRLQAKDEALRRRWQASVGKWLGPHLTGL